LNSILCENRDQILNPQFVEWMMHYPEDYTKIE
jgi:hypothetical protein